MQAGAEQPFKREASTMEADLEKTLKEINLKVVDAENDGDKVFSMTSLPQHLHSVVPMVHSMIAKSSSQVSRQGCNGGAMHSQSK